MTAGLQTADHIDLLLGHPLARPHHHLVPHDQLGGRHQPLTAVTIEHDGLIRREVE